MDTALLHQSFITMDTNKLNQLHKYSHSLWELPFTYFLVSYTVKPLCINTEQKCPDYQGVLIFQVRLHANGHFETITIHPGYTGVLIFKCPD